MKIILPTRQLYIFCAFALFISIPNILEAGCNTCNGIKKDLGAECISTNVSEGIFDLTNADTTGVGPVTSPTLKYYTVCTNNNGPSMELTGADITAYVAGNNDVIYVEVLDDMMACVEILEITLKTISFSCPSVNASTLVGCPTTGNNGVFNLTNISAETNGFSVARYFTGCSGSGGSGEITTNLTTHPDAEGDFIYVEEVDANGCANIFRVVLDLLELSVDISADPNDLFFCTGGSVNLTANVTGGTNPITYAWSTPTTGTPTDISINAATAGAPGYSVQATSNGCTVESSVVTLENRDVIVANTSRTNVTCNGLSDGTYSVTVTGGSGAYDYALSNGATIEDGGTTETFTSLPPGTYSVTVTDAASPMCDATSGNMLSITQPSVPTMTLMGIPPTTVGGGDGKIDVDREAGTADYDWNITGEETNSGTVSTNTFLIMNLDPGSYNVTVTDENGNGCPATGMVDVPDLSCSLSISGTSTNQPDCRNGNNGSIVVSASNYTGDYDIDYSGEESGSVNGNDVDDVTINNLDPGTYSITITDEANCSTTASNIVIGNPAEITFNSAESASACTGSANGVIQISNISNGTSPYTVTWNGPGNNDGSLPASSNTSRMITDLVGGSYSIIVTDANGCAPLAQDVTVNTLAAVSVSIIGDDVFCFDEGSGTLSTSPGSFSAYNWSLPMGDPQKTNASITIDNPDGSNVNYSVTVTDGSGCTGTDIISVSTLADVTIALNAGASKTSVTCDSDCDGRIDINKGGGTGSFTYIWDGPGNFSRTTEDIDNLCPGEYSVTITDSEGCSETFSQTISVPESITASASPSGVTCNGGNDGAATVSADGGTPFGGGTYQYQWSPGGSTSQSISNLSAGTYTVTVTDANGCFKTSVAVVSEPPAVVGIISPSNPEICNGESIELTASGGTSYQWAGDLGNTESITVSPTSTQVYNVIVTDAATNNCTDQASIQVTVNQLPTAEIGVSEDSGTAPNDRTICEGSSITITGDGGTSYNWSGGFSNPFTVSPSAGTETYSLTVTDSNGCTDTNNIEVTINENPTAIIDASSASQEVADIQILRNNSVGNCGDIVECLWTVEGSPFGGNECVGIQPSFNTQGSKTILLSVENSCGCTEEASAILEIFPSNQCAVEQFTVNEGLGIACAGEVLEINVEERPTPSCNVNERDFDVFENGTLLSPGGKYDYNVSTITFNEPGIYDMTYRIGDDCGCSRPASRNIEIIAPPAIEFMPGNPTGGCEGESLNIKFAGFDAGEKVVVEYSNGDQFTYEDDNFDLQLGPNPTETLVIKSVVNSTCEIEVVDQTLEISSTPEFKILSQSTDCTDDGLSYTMTIVTSGGEPGASIIADGIVGTGSGENNYVIPNLDPTQEYSFTLSKGSICDPVEVEVPMIICNCTFFVGENKVSGFSGCEDEIFNIPLDDIFSTEGSDFDPETDTLIYVLHDQNTGLNLGRVFAVYPSSTTQITNDFPGFVPNLTTYRLSIVGLRKATLGDFDLNDPTSLNSAGGNRCLSVVSGIPVVWFRAPEPQLGTQNGTNFICRDAYDYMLFARDLQSGSSITFEIEGLEGGFIRNYGFQDTAFVHFKDNGQDSFNVVITESKEYFDGNSTFSCEASTVVTLYVEDGPGAPPLSDIILWPGNILATTADTSTTCFEWGFINFGEESGVIGTDKYLYAASDIDFAKTSRIYFVDTYFCDNPGCVTRVYYNADGPTPGLQYKEEQTFSYLVKPNPNEGQFVLDLFSDFEGDYNVRIIDITGKQVMEIEAVFEQGQNEKEFDLSNVPKGIYLIQIMNNTLKEYSIDKIVIN